VQVLDLIALLERVFGKKARIEWLPMQAGDVPQTCADTARLREWVGFAPATDLEQGLRVFRDWFVAWRQKDA
jgi:UDP-glucuronate 4-epimerase